MTNLRRILSLTLTLALVVVVVAPPVQADTSLLFGQTQSYSATMRADKRVVTHAKIVFTNGEEREIKRSATFTIPDNIKASSLTVYQIIPPKKDKGCEIYETLEEWRTRTGAIEPTAPLNSEGPATQRDYDRDRKCIKPLVGDYDTDYDFKGYVSSPHYYDYGWYRAPDNSNKISFRKLEPTASGSTYTVPLSLDVEPQKDGAIMVSYLGEGFVTEFGGNYKYNYQTLKVPDTVTSVTVDINLDEDLYSKGTKARTTAAPSSAGLSMANDADIAKGTDQESRSLMELQNTIGTGGTITRTGKNLLPNDTFSVSGSFADSPWKLYAQEIFDTILLTALGASIWWFIYRWNKRRRQPANSHVTEKKSQPKTETSLPTKTNNEKVLVADSHEPRVNVPATVYATLLSGLGVLITTGLLFLVGANDYGTAPVLLPISWLLYFYFLIVLPLFLTVRHGRKTMFAWATAETIILIVMLIILYLAFALSQQQPDYYPAVDSFEGSQILR